MSKWRLRTLGFLVAVVAVVAVGAGTAHADGAHWGAPPMSHTQGVIWD